MNIYEMFGKQSEELQDLVAKFHTTLELMRKLKSTEILLSQLEITDNGWNITPSDPSN